MQRKLERMKELGCDIDGALNRMLNDSGFLLTCLNAGLEQPEFETLGEALRRGDVKTAFDAAHALKGVTGNVGLTPLYNGLVAIVEPLRAGSAAGLEEPYRRLMDERAKLRDALDHTPE